MKLDLTQAKIYKITNDYNDDIYIGSTCNSLVRRYNQHRLFSTYEKYQNIPLYKLINNIGFDRFRIQLIENYPCEDKYMLKQKEGEYIRELSTLNKRIAGRTLHEIQQTIEYKQYQKEYRDVPEHKHIMKEYYQSEKYKEYDKNRRQTPEYKEYRKEYEKEYRKTPKRQEYQKQYYIKKKEEKKLDE